MLAATSASILEPTVRWTSACLLTGRARFWITLFEGMRPERRTFRAVATSHLHPRAMALPRPSRAAHPAQTPRSSTQPLPAVSAPISATCARHDPLQAHSQDLDEHERSLGR